MTAAEGNGLRRRRAVQEAEERRVKFSCFLFLSVIESLTVAGIGRARRKSVYCGGSIVGTVKIIIYILFMVMSVVMTVIVLMQEGTSYGLGSLSGSNLDSYWGKNKGRSMEGVLVKVTRVLLVIFLAGAAVMSIGSFQ